MLKTSAAVGAAFGVTMMLFNQLNTRDKLNEIDKTTGDNARRLDALLNREPARAPDHVTGANDNHPRAQTKPHGTKTAALLAERAAQDDVAAEASR